MEIKTGITVAGATTFGSIPTLSSNYPTADAQAANRIFAHNRTGLPYHLVGLRVWNTDNYTVNYKFKKCSMVDSNGIWISKQDVDTATSALNNAGNIGVINGIRSAVLAASTLYHLFYLSDGTNSGSWVDTSKTSPSFPSGYTYSRYLSSFYTDASAYILDFNQVGRWLYHPPKSILTNGAATTYTNVSYSSYVPSNAVNVLIVYNGNITNTTGGWFHLGADTYDKWHFTIRQMVEYECGQSIIPYSSNGAGYHWLDATAGALDLYVGGYELDI